MNSKEYFVEEKFICKSLKLVLNTKENRRKPLVLFCQIRDFESFEFFGVRDFVLMPYPFNRLSFGRGTLSNPFVAIGDFLIDPGVDDPLMGQIFAAFLFQLSFSTTATTIVSGSMAERCNFKVGV
jgi:hypothetical protein